MLVTAKGSARKMGAAFARLIAGAAGVVLLGAVASASGIELPVPRQTIHPGDAITPALLIERSFPRTTAQRFAIVMSREDLVGMEAKRTLLPGQPIPLTAVAAPRLVRRGEPARLIFRERGLFIVAQVEAMQNGAAGDVVKVRNLDSGLTVVGTVQADGSVLVGY
ncbi:flagellar basal body P-ring formation chaperone FlgA [Breoghania sp.]|uniref:flagellar basal body P-ring formation chaperone FlgA n=1 Tax=Breoghania sp. TaxID=2065378 RepID=UPI002AAB3C4E|nr:flagellar basal body P-ring formation chaperone FlgA [Breoghania sp.]